jgi:uncharacterized membrane protein
MGTLVVVVILLVIFVGVPLLFFKTFVAFFRSLFKAGGAAAGKAAAHTLEVRAKSDADATLRNRLATGDIDEAEYHRLRAALSD